MLIYTAIYGNYDKLRQPQVTGNHQWVCITDALKPNGVWQARNEQCAMSDRRCSRYAKILYHQFFPNEEITIWHGGNVQLRGDLTKLVALLDNADIAVLEHNQRNCIYDEAEACIQWKLDDERTIREQMERYRADGYLAKNGLHAAFLIVRRNTKKMRKLATLWWQEVKRGSHRDQLSLDYCLWKLGIEPAIIPGNIYEGPFHNRSGFHQ